MKRSLTILLFVCCVGGTNNPDMVVTLTMPTNGSVVTNPVQLVATVSFKEKLAAPVIDRIR